MGRGGADQLLYGPGVVSNWHPQQVPEGRLNPEGGVYQDMIAGWTHTLNFAKRGKMDPRHFASCAAKHHGHPREEAVASVIHDSHSLAINAREDQLYPAEVLGLSPWTVRYRNPFKVGVLYLAREEHSAVFSESSEFYILAGGNAGLLIGRDRYGVNAWASLSETVAIATSELVAASEVA